MSKGELCWCLECILNEPFFLLNYYFCWYVQFWPVWKPLYTAETGNSDGWRKEHGVWRNNASCSLTDDWCVWKLCCPKGTVNTSRLLLLRLFISWLENFWGIKIFKHSIWFSSCLLVLWTRKCSSEKGIGKPT